MLEKGVPPALSSLTVFVDADRDQQRDVGPRHPTTLEHDAVQIDVGMLALDRPVSPVLVRSIDLPWSVGYAHNGRRACVAVGTVDPPSNPEASSTRAVKIIGPQGLHHISGYSRRCDVAVDHPADHRATLA